MTREMTPEEFATQPWDPCSVTVYLDGMRIGNYDALGEDEELPDPTQETMAAFEEWETAYKRLHWLLSLEGGPGQHRTRVNNKGEVELLQKERHG